MFLYMRTSVTVCSLLSVHPLNKANPSYFWSDMLTYFINKYTFLLEKNYLIYN